jgi:SAM-dependent methyltransferase
VTADRKAHWEKIYSEKGEEDTSWFQPRPETSLALIEASGEPPSAALIDVGGGVSRLVDHLLDLGWQRLSVLDISSTALETARQRLGEHASRVEWLETDLLDGSVGGPYRIWHDRAVFHFLTEPADRERYLEQLSTALEPGGSCIIATFGPEGPQQCSGLPVQRYAPQALAAMLGDRFTLEETRTEVHRTPAGKDQNFIYCRFRHKKDT